MSVPAQRAASPGRALEQVKAKLSEYKRRTEEAAALEQSTCWGSKGARSCAHTDRGSDDWTVSVMPHATAAPLSDSTAPHGDSPAVANASVSRGAEGMAHEGSMVQDHGEDENRETTDEIADIDSRLQALQDFLRSAKARAA
jgi:hypothetical protein